jgi:hypothetical protein
VGHKAVGQKVLADLMAKTPKVVPNKGEGWTVYYALFARAGFTDAARALAAEQGATLVDLEELGRELEGGERV